MNVKNTHRTAASLTRNIIIKIISIILIIPCLLSSCLDESSDDLPRLPARTVLFYMTGGNRLRDEMQEKIDALAKNWDVKGENHLLVYEGSGTVSRLLEIKKDGAGKGVVQVLQEYDAETVATPHIFSQVLNDMTHRYPGTDYGLVVFSQGTGWLPAGTYTHPYSLAEDAGRYLELPGFAEVIPDGMFRFIVFESGLMAGVEVAYELKDKTDYMLASSAEVPSPGFTPLYDKMLKYLYQRTPGLTEFAEEYLKYRQSLSGEARSATVSVLCPSQLAPLKSLLAEIEGNVTYWEWIDRTNIQYFDLRGQNHLFYDLEGYVREIGLQEQINRFADILKRTVIYQASTEEFMWGTQYGYKISQHCGLTIYIPVAQYEYLNEQRKKLSLFEQDTPELP